MFVYELSGCGFESNCSHLESKNPNISSLYYLGNNILWHCVISPSIPLIKGLGDSFVAFEALIHDMKKQNG